MGFLLVEYPTIRQVFVDDMQCGVTKTPFQLPNGFHRIDLGPNNDYTPSSRHVQISGEPSAAPVQTSFNPL
jgi:hypothetical protein